MSVKIEISGETANELWGNLSGLMARLGYVSQQQAVDIARQAVLKAAGQTPKAEQPTPAPEPVAEQPLEGEVLPPEQPKRRGRPPKAAPAEEKPAEAAPASEPESAPQSKQFTVDDVRMAMKDLAARVNVEAVSKLLSEFGVAKASEVPTERIAEFVEKAKAAS